MTKTTEGGAVAARRGVPTQAYLAEVVHGQEEHSQFDESATLRKILRGRVLQPLNHEERYHRCRHSTCPRGVAQYAFKSGLRRPSRYEAEAWALFNPPSATGDEAAFPMAHGKGDPKPASPSDRGQIPPVLQILRHQPGLLGDCNARCELGHSVPDAQTLVATVPIYMEFDNGTEGAAAQQLHAHTIVELLVPLGPEVQRADTRRSSSLHLERDPRSARGTTAEPAPVFGWTTDELLSIVVQLSGLNTASDSASETFLSRLIVNTSGQLGGTQHISVLAAWSDIRTIRWLLSQIETNRMKDLSSQGTASRRPFPLHSTRVHGDQGHMKGRLASPDPPPLAVVIQVRDPVTGARLARC